MNEQLLRTAQALQKSGRHAEAEQLYTQILRDHPGNVPALLMLGYLYFQRGQLPEALTQFDRVLTLIPESFEALSARGAVLSSLDRHDKALDAYERAIKLHPRNAQVYNNRANSLLALGRLAAAIESYEQALRLDPTYVQAWCNRGIALLQCSRPEDALDSFKRALGVRPDHADAWAGCATALVRLERRPEALAAYDRLAALREPTPDILYNRANTNSILKHHEAAIRDCGALLSMAPDYPYARGVLVHSKMQICDWAGLDEETERIAEALDAGRRVITPFNLKALSDSAELHLRCAKVWVANELPQDAAPMAPHVAYRHDRIKLAYVSGDFGNTAVAWLMAPVFESHNHERFEVDAISFGPPDRSAMRARLEKSFDSFVDVSGQSDLQIASLIRDLQIDIAVDLMGFTGQCRSAILAHGPAPVQINYLGFPGSLGAPWIDYIIADHTVVPASHEQHYSEKIIRMPHCYLPADPAKLGAGRVTDRRTAGLPRDVFVFASFNNAYKFSQQVFSCWMRILRRVESGILWLPQNNPAARDNLIREAAASGVAPERLVFAAPVPEIEAHLSRLAAADLFLDTTPYNSHSTAIDALTAGVPIVTVLGNSFASRVAASVLHAAGLSELVTESLAAYEELAVRLATNPEILRGIHERTAQAGRTPLFDGVNYVRKLEEAFEAAWERSRTEASPESFAVLP